jgi:hypothetical protein
MSEENNQKLAYYHDYCHKCKNKDLPDYEDPCNECLNQPYNYDSHKPINFKENSQN